MSDVLRSYTKGHFTANIYAEEYLNDPREENEYLGEMLHWHPRYILGDKRIDGDYAQETVDEIDEDQDEFILPLYLYDHSGLAMSTSNWRYPFNDRWDAGMVGVIHASLKDARKFGFKADTDEELRTRVIECLKSEVEEYDQYLRGEVYWFQILDDEEEVVDSCGYIYGWEYAEDYTQDELESQYKHFLEQELASKIGGLADEIVDTAMRCTTEIFDFSIERAKILVDLWIEDDYEIPDWYNEDEIEDIRKMLVVETGRALADYREEQPLRMHIAHMVKHFSYDEVQIAEYMLDHLKDVINAEHDGHAILDHVRYAISVWRDMLYLTGLRRSEMPLLTKVGF